MLGKEDDHGKRERIKAFSSCFPIGTVMKLTDFALNEAKKRGRNRCYTFDEKDYALFLRKREIAQELRESIRIGCQGFVAFFQPVFKAENGKLSGAEDFDAFFF